MSGPRVTFLGHSTVHLQLDGVRLLADPLLASRILFLENRAPVPSAEYLQALDAVLITHHHADHLHKRSLRAIEGRPPVLSAPGGSRHLAGLGLGEVTELAAGESREVDSVRVSAVPASHEGSRWPWSRSVPAVGFVATGSRSVYFAGDTDFFDGMRDIGPVDLALIPVWGWGTKLGKGHLDPREAAEALAAVGARTAIPIHWGSLVPVTRRSRRPELLTEPPREFARHAAELAPDVEVRVLEPGEGLDF